MSFVEIMPKKITYLNLAKNDAKSFAVAFLGYGSTIDHRTSTSTIAQISTTQKHVPEYTPKIKNVRVGSENFL